LFFQFGKQKMKNILAIQSHVVFGHAGNSAANSDAPPRRQRLALNTVQFSNHTQYGKWTGCVMPPSHLTEIVQGIADIDQLRRCDAVLSGYLGSAEQGEHILGIVRQVKAANPAAKYFCDGDGAPGERLHRGARRGGIPRSPCAAGQRYYCAKPG
jgi:pyridoxine kinase